MHIVKYRDSAVSCDKMAELIEMQFGMLSQVRPGTCITWDVDASTGRALLRVFGQLKSIVKLRTLGVGHCKV